MDKLETFYHEFGIYDGTVILILTNPYMKTFIKYQKKIKNHEIPFFREESETRIKPGEINYNFKIHPKEGKSIEEIKKDIESR